jgi:low temperature requirement protein LtrA
MVGGPMLFLIGCLLFKWATAGWAPLSHMVGIALLAGSLVFAAAMPPLVLAGLSTAILIVVAAWEAISLGSAGTTDHEEASR